MADYVAGRSDLAHVLVQGRWASIKCLSRYLQSGMAALALTRLPPPAQALCEDLAGLVSGMIPLP